MMDQGLIQSIDIGALRNDTLGRVQQITSPSAPAAITAGYDDPLPASTASDGKSPPGESGGRSQRFLECRWPQNVRRESEFAIVVRVTQFQTRLSLTPLSIPKVPEGGARL